MYPALANVLVVPFSALPFWAAGLIYTLLSAAAMVGGIWLLGVRDRRCLALTLVSWPFLFGAFLGAIGPFLVLGAGVAWRWRDRIWPPAVALATIIAVKIFPWTLAVWLLFTRRYKALALCVAAGVVLTFGAWALIGFDGLREYPQMLSNMSFIQEDRSVSIVGVLVIAGVSSGVATAVAMAMGAGPARARLAPVRRSRRRPPRVRAGRAGRPDRDPDRLGALHGAPVHPHRPGLAPASRLRG